MKHHKTDLFLDAYIKVYLLWTYKSSACFMIRKESETQNEYAVYVHSIIYS